MFLSFLCLCNHHLMNFGQNPAVIYLSVFDCTLAHKNDHVNFNYQNKKGRPSSLSSITGSSLLTIQLRLHDNSCMWQLASLLRCTERSGRPGNRAHNQPHETTDSNKTQNKPPETTKIDSTKARCIEIMASLQQTLLASSVMPASCLLGIFIVKPNSLYFCLH